MLTTVMEPFHGTAFQVAFKALALLPIQFVAADPISLFGGLECGTGVWDWTVGLDSESCAHHY